MRAVQGWSLAVIFLLSIAVASALTDFTPSGNINMRARNVTNASKYCLGAQCITNWSQVNSSGGGGGTFDFFTIASSANSSQVRNATTVNISPGTGISIAQVGNSSNGINITITNTVTDTNDTTRVNSLVVNNITLFSNASSQQTAIDNLQTANISLNSSVSTLSTNASVQQAQINSMLNLTYAQIVTGIGNWSADKGALPNLTLAQIVTNIGNWSFDKGTLSFRLGISSGNNTNVSNGTLVNITNGSGIALVQVGTGPINVTITNTGVLSETDPKTSGNGNWSADKGALPNLTLAQIATNVGNYTSNATGWSVCGSGNFSRWNGTGFNCEADQSGSGGSGWTNTSTLIRTVVNTTNVTALNTTGSLPLFFLDGTNGRVGIGTMTPAKKLDVVGDVNVSGNVTVGVGAMVFNISTDAANNTFLGVLQNLSLGAIVPNHKLHINGTLGVEGAVNFKNTLCSAGTVLTADGTTGLLSCLNLNLGNWSADKGALPNLTHAQIVTAEGNWSQDKANVAWRLGIATGNTSNVANSTLVNLTAGAGIVLTQTGTGPINLSIASSITQYTDALVASAVQNTTILRNSTSVNFTKVVITGNLTFIDTDNSSCIFLGNGGKLCSFNSTCISLYSPNGSTRSDICN